MVIFEDPFLNTSVNYHKICCVSMKLEVVIGKVTCGIFPYVDIANQKDMSWHVMITNAHASSSRPKEFRCLGYIIKIIGRSETIFGLVRWYIESGLKSTAFVYMIYKAFSLIMYLQYLCSIFEVLLKDLVYHTGVFRSFVFVQMISGNGVCL